MCQNLTNPVLLDELLFSRITIFDQLQFCQINFGRIDFLPLKILFILEVFWHVFGCSENELVRTSDSQIGLPL